MPGVDVITETIGSPSSATGTPAGRYFVAGFTERGSTTDAIRLRSMRDYEDEFGARVAYGALYDDLLTFFAEGGGEAYVGRAVGPAATVASRTLNDRAGAPQPTLRIDAVNAGAWGAAITVAVADGGPANTFTITITGPDGSTEVYADLADPAAAVAALASSKWVRATNLGSPTAAPGNIPAVIVATALNGGTDDRAAVTAASMVAAADALFGPELGAGAIAVPGQASAAVGAGLLAHASANNRIALLSTAAAQTPAQALASAADLTGDAGSEFAGLFYPWLTIPGEAGTSRTISPTGYVAACRARAHLDQGPERAPAGAIAEARFVSGLERELTRSEADDLDASNVNAIRTIAGTTRLYGWTSLSTDEDNWALLTGRDLLDALVVDAEDAMEAFVFRTIDGKGHIFAEVAAELRALVEPIRSRGGLYPRLDAEGQELDPGYRVDTGPAINTPATTAAGQIRALLAVRVSPTGTLIEVTIAKAAVGATL